MKKIQSYYLIIGLILAGILSRLIPHAPNFTAVGATALFAGAVLRPTLLAFTLPLIIMWLSDLVLNNGMYKNMYPEHYTGWVWMGNYWVYLGFLLISLTGKAIITKIKPRNLLTGSFAASILFFIVSNFGVWLTSISWPKNIAGLIACYTVAIPFFWNTLFADLLFTISIFSIYVWVADHKTVFAKA